MMKTMGLLAVAAAVAMLAGCGSNADHQQTATTTVADTTTTQEQIDRIAGDKNQVVDVMKRANDKGTLDDAIELAMSDSVFASQVMAMVEANPKLAALFTSKTSAAKAARSHTASAAGTAQRGDLLDRTEQSVNKANAKIDQAGRIKDQATEAKHKIDVILKP